MGYANRKKLFLRYPNEVARKYGVGVHRYTHERQIRCVKDLLEIAQAKADITDVLDCPCGSGRIAAELSGYSVTCADSSQGRIQRASANVPDAVSCDVADIFNLPYADGSFDLALTVLLLQHIDRSDLRQLFLEVGRVTRRWWIVTYSNKFQAFSMARGLQPNPKHTLSQREFDAIAFEAGFRRIARRFVVPGIAASVVVLLEKIR